MKKQILINQLNKGKFISIKVTVHHGSVNSKTTLEVHNASGISLEYIQDNKTDNKTIESMQIKMVRKAAEYSSIGVFAVINPFTD